MSFGVIFIFPKALRFFTLRRTIQKHLILPNKILLSHLLHYFKTDKPHYFIILIPIKCQVKYLALHLAKKVAVNSEDETGAMAGWRRIAIAIKQ